MQINDIWLLFLYCLILFWIGGCIVWLIRRGIQTGWFIWSLLITLIFSAVVAGLIFLNEFKIALIGLALIIIVTIGFQTYLIWRYTIQQSEVARMRRIAERRADQVSSLSHEIRTPLAMIKGSSELLLEGNPGPLTEKQVKFLETIRGNCENMILLAEDLLVQARIDAGLFKLRPEAVDLVNLVRQLIRELQPTIELRSQLIRLDYPQVMDRVHADPRLIRQVLTNLIQNASRFTSQKGHIFITIQDNDAAVVVSITDDGAGMTTEERQQLFQKFASGRPLGDGTGLGLVITKQIIELHGGQILIDTNLGKGTTFLFTLPHWRS